MFMHKISTRLVCVSGGHPKIKIFVAAAFGFCIRFCAKLSIEIIHVGEPSIASSFSIVYFKTILIWIFLNRVVKLNNYSMSTRWI